MAHRYLNPHWWSLRLALRASAVLPDPAVMWCIGQTGRLWGERELRLLHDFVPADKIAVDVGAANGVYAWCLSRLARECVAFEPNPQQADLLRRRLPAVQVIACALSDTEGPATLKTPVRNGQKLSGWATIAAEGHGPMELGKDFCAEEVPARTLDSFGLRGVGFIKIDVEGHEVAVLRGAMDTISRDRPVILAEIGDEGRSQARTEAVEMLTDAGYTRLEQSFSSDNGLFLPRAPG